ncbi:MAG: hypothetical protein AAF525_14775 [Pseudomonadota bacterium]
MTQFEYVAIASSLLLSFGLARVLSNIGPVFARETRYWVHAGFVILLLWNHFMVFFMFGRFHGVEEWTLGKCLISLLAPVAVVIGGGLLIPANTIGQDFRGYFERIRAPFYVFCILGGVLNLLEGYVFFSQPNVESWAVAGLTSLLFGMGLVVRRASVDKWLMSVFVLWTIAWVTSTLLVDELSLVLFDPTIFFD